MYRGQNTPRGGRGTPGGGGRGSRGNTPRGSGTNTPRGRGRGRGGGGGFARFEVEQEAQVVMAELGISYPSPYRGRGGGGQRGFSPFRGAFTPPSGRGRGYTPPSGRGKRGGGLGYRAMPEDDRGYEWARPIGGGGGSVLDSGGGGRGRERERDPRQSQRPLLKPIVFVKAGTLFEERDELLKAEVQDADEDQEATADWLAKAFERAAEIERAVEHDSAQPSGAPSGIQTPRDTLEELVAQSVMPGIFLQATTTTRTITVELPKSVGAMEIDSEEEDEVVYVAPAQRSQVASMGPSPALPAAPLPVPAPLPAPESAPAPTALPTTSLPPTLPVIPAIPTIPQPHSLIHSLDPSRAATPDRFPTASVLSGLLKGFVGKAAEGTTSAASTPCEMVGEVREGAAVGLGLEEIVKALQAEVVAPAVEPAEVAPAPLVETAEVLAAPAPVVDTAEVVSVPAPAPIPAVDTTEATPVQAQVEEAVPSAFPDAAAAAVPTFETFAFSPTFSSPRNVSSSKGKSTSLKRKEIKRLRRAALRQRTKLSMPGGEEAGPRVGDSDLEWGTDGPPVRVPGGEEEEDSDSDDEEDELEFTAAADKMAAGSLSDALATMDIDMLDEDAMARFALGWGAQQLSIADLDVEERIKRENGDKSSSDEEVSGSESESEDLDEVLREAEKELLGESDDDEEIDELDEDDDEEEALGEDGQPVAGPSGGFQARLVRAKAAAAKATASKKKKWRLNYDEEESSDDEEMFEGGFAWDDKDGNLVDEIQAVLDGNDELLKGDRKSRKKLFSAIRDGNLGGIVDMDDALFASSILKSKNRKRNDLPPELQILWDKDRAKKADYKRARALERKRQLGNPFKTASKDKGKGKKGKSNPDESDTSETDSEFEAEFEDVTDMFSLERMIRVFLRDLGKTTMTLPAMDKESRRRVHLLADCFKLKSQSKGKGTDRFPILTKTTRSGIAINEKRVERILRASKNSGPGSNMAEFNKAMQGKQRKDKGGGKSNAHHGEGEIVGAKAAKIADTNVGYKMLQMMGWSEGDRIGLTAGGIIDPLTARIKRTKLGLGAAL
ncbi:hypothetical protein CALCODRAFT_74789 [Calocera cornea HHB12733]|uniref:Protein SQS1 n=1 Tax=Calocera cornea HHB12733 TaxID=1353952 RepID=A0A165DI85_9BASI|nr:hypothetical protein CALCODRAFT_74789 [Calocera cornea HHB12733]